MKTSKNIFNKNLSLSLKTFLWKKITNSYKMLIKHSTVNKIKILRNSIKTCFCLMNSLYKKVHIYMISII
jgi:hypothetical protein